MKKPRPTKNNQSKMSFALTSIVKTSKKRSRSVNIEKLAIEQATSKEVDDSSDYSNALSSLSTDQVDELCVLVLKQLRVRFRSKKLNNALNEPPNADFLIKLESIFANNYQNANFAMNDIIENMQSTKNIITTRMKKITGTTPVAYLIAYRLECAQILIERQDICLKKIIHAVGFKTQANFIKHFRNYFGISLNSKK